jgi:ubiquinone/menaquinone biosynthesis C-methylase UbiE
MKVRMTCAMLLAAACLSAFGHAGLQAQGRTGNSGGSRAESRIFPPEKLGELEGPDRDLWQKPEQVMDALSIADGTTVADLGAGGGWFTVRLARRVGPQGVVYAEDIQEQMLESIDRRVKREGLRNVRMLLGTSDDPKLPKGRLQAVLIVDVYHEVTQPVEFLRNVRESLTPHGRLGIIEFKRDGGGPGPPIDERAEEANVVKYAEAAGFKLISRETFLPYQYLLIFGKNDISRK